MKILDISNNNSAVDFKAVKRAGITGVYLKASEGLTFVDKTFAARRAAAQKAGLRVGAYHFARPDAHPNEATAEAALFCRVIGKVGPLDFRPALDYEVKDSTGQDGEWIHKFNEVVFRVFGVLPLFYSYSALIQSLGLKQPRGAGLWLAAYSRNDGVEHPYVVPAPWKKVAAHQFSSNCLVTGCGSQRVDLSTVYQPNALLAHPFKATNKGYHLVRRLIDGKNWAYTEEPQ